MITTLAGPVGLLLRFARCKACHAFPFSFLNLLVADSKVLVIKIAFTDSQVSQHPTIDSPKVRFRPFWNSGTMASPN